MSPMPISNETIDGRVLTHGRDPDTVLKCDRTDCQGIKQTVHAGSVRFFKRYIIVKNWVKVLINKNEANGSLRLCS